jgi:hypothetical protein
MCSSLGEEFLIFVLAVSKLENKISNTVIFDTEMC